MNIEAILSRMRGVRRNPNGRGWIAVCPAHHDHRPSLSVRQGGDGRVLLYCFSGCTTDRICAALGIRVADLFPPTEEPLHHREPTSDGASARFKPEDAARVWNAGLARARDDHVIEADRAVYAYLSQRRLMTSWEDCAFGIVAPGMALPEAIQHWPGRGYRLVVPLYDRAGRVVNVQARAITKTTPKTLFPPGSRAAGTLFADRRGQQVLTGRWTGPRQVLLGEGLTDHLALTIASPIPVLSAPGTGMAAAGIGRWAAGRAVFVALDGDPAGAAATTAAAKQVHAMGGQPLRVAWPGHKKDACEVLEEYGVEFLADFLQRITAERERGRQHAA